MNIGSIYYIHFLYTPPDFIGFFEGGLEKAIFLLSEMTYAHSTCILLISLFIFQGLINLFIWHTRKSIMHLFRLYLYLDFVLVFKQCRFRDSAHLHQLFIGQCSTEGLAMLPDQVNTGFCLFDVICFALIRSSTNQFTIQACGLDSFFCTLMQVSNFLFTLIKGNFNDSLYFFQRL